MKNRYGSNGRLTTPTEVQVALASLEAQHPDAPEFVVERYGQREGRAAYHEVARVSLPRLLYALSRVYLGVRGVDSGRSHQPIQFPPEPRARRVFRIRSAREVDAENEPDAA